MVNFVKHDLVAQINFVRIDKFYLGEVDQLGSNYTSLDLIRYDLATVKILTHGSTRN